MIIRRDSIPNFWRAVRRAYAAFMAGRKVIAEPDVISIRRSRCYLCPYSTEDFFQCTQCACVIELKTMIATESCPINRWDAQTRFSRGV